jgi:hypothetical protein
MYYDNHINYRGGAGIGWVDTAYVTKVLPVFTS